MAYSWEPQPTRAHHLQTIDLVINIVMTSMSQSSSPGNRPETQDHDWLGERGPCPNWTAQYPIHLFIYLGGKDQQVINMHRCNCLRGAVGPPAAAGGKSPFKAPTVAAAYDAVFTSCHLGTYYVSELRAKLLASSSRTALVSCPPHGSQRATHRRQHHLYGQF